MSVAAAGRVPENARPVLVTVARGERLETHRAAGIAGLAFALLFVLAIMLRRNARPASGSSPQEIADFYLKQDAGGIAVVGLYAPFAGIALLWFIAAVRSTIGAHEDQF